VNDALVWVRWLLLYLASRAGLLLPRRAIPTRFAYAVAVRVADLCYLLFVGPRRKLIANLTRVLGDEALARRTARQAFRQYAKYIIDLFQLPALGPAAVRARTDFHAWDALDAVIAEGKGTIFVTMHFGQQETGAAVMAATGYTPNVIARTLEFGPINRLVQGFRREMGMNIIPAEKGRLQTFRCLAQNGVLGMLIDMVENGEGVSVQFFGARARMSGAAARIALRTGARVVPTAIARDPADDRRFVPVIDAGLRFEPTGDEEADVLALTQEIARRFEGFVRAYPDQWFAFRPVWEEDGDAAARPARKRRAGRNDRLNHLGLEVANTVFGRLPKPAAYATADLVADAAFLIRRRIRANVEDNMRHVVPTADRRRLRYLAREVFRNVCRYYADLIRMPRTRPEDLLSREMTVEGLDRLKRAMSGGRGAVVATAHFGNPEIATQVSSLMGLDVLVLSEPLNPPAFSELVHRLRESQGVRYEEVGFKTIGHALQHLRRGGTIGITCDRDIQGTGAFLPFFGEPTRLPLGAAELALRTGAVLAPAYCRRSGNGYAIVFEEPIPPAHTGHPKSDAIAMTIEMVRRMESWIRSDPGQWMVLERIWDESRPAASAASGGVTINVSGEGQEQERKG